MLECTRESLNIRTCPRGLIIGPIDLYIDEHLIVDCMLGGGSGNVIPTEIDKINGVRLKPKVEYILVVEKETVFHALSDLGFHTKNNCIIVTGRGQADNATRILLRKLKDRLDVPVYALVDGNPHGMSIYLTYRYGSENRGYDTLLAAVPDLILLGVFTSEAKAGLTKMTDAQKVMLTNMLAAEHINSDVELTLKLHAMKTGGACADIEAIMKQENIEDYIVKKILEIRL